MGDPGARRAPPPLPRHPWKMLVPPCHLQVAFGGAEPVPLEMMALGPQQHQMPHLLSEENALALPTSWCHLPGCTGQVSNRRCCLSQTPAEPAWGHMSPHYSCPDLSHGGFSWPNPALGHCCQTEPAHVHRCPMWSWPGRAWDVIRETLQLRAESLVQRAGVQILYLGSSAATGKSL